MEETIIKADIFFFISTVCLIILTILFSVVLVYGIRIAHDVKKLARRAREEGELILEDAKSMREDVKSVAEKLVSLLSGWFIIKKATRKKKHVSEN